MACFFVAVVLQKKSLAREGYVWGGGGGGGRVLTLNHD
jgi:hypothetical protein